MDEQVKLQQGPVPATPSCLCFTSYEFIQDDFSVDKFISEHKKRVQLECVRDDLNVYLNVLKSAMIELINKDYADFVNLSSNLVGLDKAINHLSIPLGQLKEEVMGVKSSVDEAIIVASEKLARKQLLRDKKVKVQRIMELHQRLGQAENSLSASSPTDEAEFKLSEEQLERLVIDVHQLNFDLNKSAGCPVSDQLRPRLEEVTRVLQHSLQCLFLESIDKEECSSLRRCLRTYAGIDKVGEVESLVASTVVRPTLQQIISEKHLKSDGLDAIFNEVLSTIPIVCGKLLLVTSASKTEDGIPGYDFLTNSVWPEIASLLETKLSSVFGPGNPDMFHKKYRCSMDFLDRFEQTYACIADVNRLRQHHLYSHFNSRWNLPVYFQIRYQEIASALESHLVASSPRVRGGDDDRRGELEACVALHDCMVLCWSRDVYLPSLAHRFWKLTLELLSRFDFWLDHLISKQTKVLSNRSKEDDNECGSVSSASSASSKPVASTMGDDGSGLSVQDMVLLVADVDALTPRLQSFYSTDIEKTLQSFGMKDTTTFKASYMALLAKISRHPCALERLLMSRVVLDCEAHLKMVADIPRLYRRTNKEVPNKPSAYVTNILKPLQVFLNNHKNTLLSDDSAVDRISLWKINVLEKVTEQYLSVTSDVLMSVRKTEDSLKRLKKARDRSNVALSTGSSNTMSDDDKIRLQLFLDVDNYGHQITLFEVETSGVNSYLKILELVESARNSPEKCYKSYLATLH